MALPKNPKDLQSIIEQLAAKSAVTGYVVFSSDIASREGYDHFAAIDTALNVEPEKPYHYPNMR
jgi:hypothetical protein